MNVGTVMQQIADQLDTIPGLRVFAYPPERPPAPPAAIVTFPEDYSFDATYGRGMDRFTLPVVVLVGRVSDRTARDRLGVFMDGSGASSIKQAVEAGAYNAFDSVRVMSVEFDSYEQGGNPYLSATFMLDIAGQGAI